VRPPIRPLAPLLALALALGLGAASACSSWQAVHEYGAWTLYRQRDSEVDESTFQAAFTPAFAAVEELFGPFRSKVRVHAWHEREGRADPLAEAEASIGYRDVPGIGPARIQAYHARGIAGPLSPTGVFIGQPDVGTAVHELVHARLAEDKVRLPLWFEEGLASLVGDGIAIDAVWVVDGLACWPLRELREEALDELELARLLRIRASDRTSVKDNVMVHFVGWAVVFDLYRETGRIDWELWRARFDFDDQLADAHRRMLRTLAPHTPLEWLERLDDPDRRVRLAAAKGTWKLRSRAVLERLLDALEIETDPEVRVGLAVNALAAAGEVRISGQRWWRAVFEALANAELQDPEEARAIADLYQAYRWQQDKDEARDALSRLTRFWEE